MSNSFSLETQVRTNTGRRAVQELRKQGLVPGNVYGHGLESKSVQFPALVFTKMFDQAGESSIINLTIDGGQSVPVLVHGLDRDPITTAVTHVDFYQVRMDEKITAEVQMVFNGIAPAVKELGGILITNFDTIEVECLPKDLPHDIQVDLTTLKTFEDHIRFKNIVLPEGVVALHDLEDTIVSVSEPRSEAELDSLNEAVVEDVSAVEVEAKKKDDEETPVEGEPAVAEKK